MKPQQRNFAHRVGPLLAPLFLAAVGSATTAWAQTDSRLPLSLPAVVVPGFGPGVAGHISIDPITLGPCRVGVPCEGPFPDARVLVLDSKSDIVGTAVTNAQGNFIVSVPPGVYLVHVQVDSPRFPQCGEAKATVGRRAPPPARWCSRGSTGHSR